ncbi:MAG: amidohydrolase family protein [Armatimonadetes bacterium]|nr:amidohydrolase family protein [Armatimonadota bacterium]
MAAIIDINTFFGPSQRPGVDWSLDELLRLMDRYHVERALTLSLLGVHYDFVSGNTETLQACRRHPQLIPVGTVDPRRYIDCADEIKRCLDEGVRVFRFFPDAQGWPVEHRHFIDLCEQIADARAAIMVAAGNAGWPSRLAQLLGDLPAPVVLLGVGYGVFSELLAALSHCPSFYCDGQMFDTPGAYELVRDVAGADRVIFGSGIPERYFASAYFMVIHSELTEDERRAVLYRNAARVLLGEGE